MVDHRIGQLADWTVMVYIAADDPLATFAVRSLKQLKDVASHDHQMVVAAQFDANGRQNIPRLIFAGVAGGTGSIQDDKRDDIPADTDMADPSALASFIDWAYAHCKARHYCLVLWGHGPELLIDDYAAGASGKPVKKFLTPSDLRGALQETRLRNDGHKFDIVAIDSCCMSMVELAVELQDHTEFLVASQEEVPDFSFPYDKLLTFSGTDNRDQIVKICQAMPGLYIDGYRDYILTRDAKPASITLSSLSLKDVATVTKPLVRLAGALIDSVHDAAKRQVVIDARADSRAFVSGLYVDLYDFCERLRSGLSLKKIHDLQLVEACREICDSIASNRDNPFVLASESPQDRHCHGVSIYFPCLTSLEIDPAVPPPVPMVRGSVNIMKPGGTNTLPMNGKETRQRGGLDALNKGGLDALNKAELSVLNKNRTDILGRMRRRRIEETEFYYPDLKLSKETRWDEFIRHGWSRWLAEDAEAIARSSPETDLSELLDQRYSAQQCALNLLSLCRDLEQHSQSSDTGAGKSQTRPRVR